MKKILSSLVIFMSINAHAFSVTTEKFTEYNFQAVLAAPLNQYIPPMNAIEEIRYLKADADHNPIYSIKAGACALEVTVKITPIPGGIGSGMVRRNAVVTNTGSGCLTN